MTNRVGGGVVLFVDKVRAQAAPAASDALEAQGREEEGGGGGLAAAAAVSDAGVDVHEASPPRRLPQDLAHERQSQRTASVVVVRGTAPRVSAAGAMLLERLKVREGEGGTPAARRARTPAMLYLRVSFSGRYRLVVPVVVAPFLVI